MALKPTIYKAKISLSDLNRHHYDTLNLTIAKHPSETSERMMVRLLAFCINAQEYLSFTKGLSTVEEPALWSRTLDDQISLWIDVGEPAVERIKKASRMASSVKVYCFNLKSDVWWGKNQREFSQLNVSLYKFLWEDIQALTQLTQRTMVLSFTITDNSVFIASELGECEIPWEVLQDA